MNSYLLQQCLLLAQNAGGGGQQQQPGGGLLGLPFLLMTLMLVFYLLVMRPQRREQQARQSMLTQLKKNDRVVTVGGIYGVVTNVRPEADEVTIKVDESSNVRLKVTMASIARVVGDESSPDAKSTS